MSRSGILVVDYLDQLIDISWQPAVLLSFRDWQTLSLKVCQHSWFLTHAPAIDVCPVAPLTYPQIIGMYLLESVQAFRLSAGWADTYAVVAVVFHNSDSFVHMVWLPVCHSLSSLRMHDTNCDEITT
jgi:hypothetical protein